MITLKWKHANLDAFMNLDRPTLRKVSQSFVYLSNVTKPNFLYATFVNGIAKK